MWQIEHLQIKKSCGGFTVNGYSIYNKGATQHNLTNQWNLVPMEQEGLIYLQNDQNYNY